MQTLELGHVLHPSIDFCMHESNLDPKKKDLTSCHTLDYDSFMCGKSR